MVDNPLFAKIKKFDGKINFNLWKIDMFDLLVQSGLHQAIDSKGKPADMKDAEWEQITLKALSLIRLCLADEIKCNILTEKSAASLWARLSADFTGTSVLDRMYWKQKLFRFSMKEGTSLHDHIIEYHKVLSELLAIGVDNVEEEDKVYCLVYSLPTSYNHLIQTLLHRKTLNELSLAELIKALKEDELRRETQAAGPTSGAALTTHKGNSEDSSAHNRRSLFCNYCRLRGHEKADCFRWKKKKEKEKEKEGEANLVATSPEFGFCMFASSSSSDSKSSWYLDSGSSTHICFSRDSFATYAPVSGRSVVLATGEECVVQGEGTVRLQVRGQKIYELKNVLHIPRFKRCIISLGALQAHGCRYTAQGGVLSVYKSCRRLFRSRVSHRNQLYEIGDVKTWPSKVTQPNVPPIPVKPPQNQQSLDNDVRTASEVGDNFRAGGVRAESSASAITPTQGIHVGSVWCPILSP